jgi:hypothetical protein
MAMGDLPTGWWWEMPLLALTVMCGIGELRRFLATRECELTIDDLQWFSFLPSMPLGFALSWSVFGCWIGWHWWWALAASVPGTVLIGFTIQMAVVWMLAPAACDYDQENGWRQLWTI